MTCKLCLVPGYKDWSGDDPKCHFEKGGFNTEGWNCGTANALRKAISPDLIQYYEDRNFLCINIAKRELRAMPLFLFMSWYKSRGRLDSIQLLYSNGSVKVATEEDCVALIEFIQRDKR